MGGNSEQKPKLVVVWQKILSHEKWHKCTFFAKYLLVETHLAACFGAFRIH
jgi:hypothetical protein